jgi:excisionase family DNA binding protein
MSLKTNGQLLTRKQAARRLGISDATLSRLMAAGAISFYKVGWRTLFDDAQIEAYLASVRRPSHVEKSAEASAA